MVQVLQQTPVSTDPGNSGDFVGVGMEDERAGSSATKTVNTYGNSTEFANSADLSSKRKQPVL